MLASGYPRSQDGDAVALMVAKVVLALISLLVGIAVVFWVRVNPWWVSILLLIFVPAVFALAGGLLAGLYERAYRWAQRRRDPFYRPNLVWVAVVWPVFVVVLVSIVPVIFVIERLFPAEAH